MRCAVKNCKNSNKMRSRAISFFSFPVETALQKQWASFCGGKRIVNVRSTHICMDHFAPESFENNLQYDLGFSKKRRLKHGALPTIFPNDIRIKKLFSARAERIEKRDNKKIVAELIQEYDETINDQSSHLSANQSLDIVGTLEPKCELKYEKDNNELLEDELGRLRKENLDLKRMQREQADQLIAFNDRMEFDAKNYAKSISGLNNRLVKTKLELQNMEDKLLGILSKSQVDQIKSGTQCSEWTEESIARSLSLYSGSAKLYQYLYRKNFPLPPVRKLQVWAETYMYPIDFDDISD